MNIGDGNNNLNGDTGLASHTALLGSDRHTEMEQQFQTEGVPMHSVPKPSDVVSHSQRVSFQLTRQAIRWYEYCCLQRHSLPGLPLSLPGRYILSHGSRAILSNSINPPEEAFGFAYRWFSNRCGRQEHAQQRKRHIGRFKGSRIQGC
jgi:hypothetical protein